MLSNYSSNISYLRVGITLSRFDDSMLISSNLSDIQDEVNNTILGQEFK